MTVCTPLLTAGHGSEAGHGSKARHGGRRLGVLQLPCSNQVVANCGWDVLEEGGGKDHISASIEAIKSGCPV